MTHEMPAAQEVPYADLVGRVAYFQPWSWWQPGMYYAQTGEPVPGPFREACRPVEVMAYNEDAATLTVCVHWTHGESYLTDIELRHGPFVLDDPHA